MQPVDEFVDSNITLFAVWLKNLNTKVQKWSSNDLFDAMLRRWKHDWEIVMCKKWK